MWTLALPPGPGQSPGRSSLWQWADRRCISLESCGLPVHSCSRHGARWFCRRLDVSPQVLVACIVFLPRSQMVRRAGAIQTQPSWPRPHYPGETPNQTCLGTSSRLWPVVTGEGNAARGIWHPPGTATGRGPWAYAVNCGALKECPRLSVFQCGP
jgi:hypothetical protein